MTNIAHRNLNWEVDRGKHLREENPPPSRHCHKSKCPSRYLQLMCKLRIALSNLPVGARQYYKSEQKTQEDGDKDQIGSEGADEVDE